MYCLIYVYIYSIKCFAYIDNKFIQIKHYFSKYVTEYLYSTSVSGIAGLSDVRAYRTQ